jgi:archaellum component FlaF (FlaF/FlaG flagellin family)
MNVVRHKPKFDLGPVSQTILIAVLIVAVGLIYVTQGVKASSFDYDIKRVDDEVAELAAKRDDLAAENARLTSISNASSSEVAANMVEAGASGYVTE